eukprot:scaffold3151_cov385-Prasinococcus_capsulatus_cf.AAC.1
MILNTYAQYATLDLFVKDFDLRDLLQLRLDGNLSGDTLHVNTLEIVDYDGSVWFTNDTVAALTSDGVDVRYSFYKNWDLLSSASFILDTYWQFATLDLLVKDSGMRDLLQLRLDGDLYGDTLQVNTLEIVDYAGSVWFTNDTAATLTSDGVDVRYSFYKNWDLLSSASIILDTYAQHAMLEMLAKDGDLRDLLQLHLDGDLSGDTLQVNTLEIVDYDGSVWFTNDTVATLTSDGVDVRYSFYKNWDLLSSASFILDTYWQYATLDLLVKDFGLRDLLQLHLDGDLSGDTAYVNTLEIVDYVGNVWFTNDTVATLTSDGVNGRYNFYKNWILTSNASFILDTYWQYATLDLLVKDSGLRDLLQLHLDGDLYGDTLHVSTLEIVDYAGNVWFTNNATATLTTDVVEAHYNFYKNWILTSSASFILDTYWQYATLDLLVKDSGLRDLLQLHLDGDLSGDTLQVNTLEIVDYAGSVWFTNDTAATLTSDGVDVRYSFYKNWDLLSSASIILDTYAQFATLDLLVKDSGLRDLLRLRFHGNLSGDTLQVNTLEIVDHAGNVWFTNDTAATLTSDLVFARYSFYKNWAILSNSTASGTMMRDEGAANRLLSLSLSYLHMESQPIRLAVEGQLDLSDDFHEADMSAHIDLTGGLASRHFVELLLESFRWRLSGATKKSSIAVSCKLRDRAWSGAPLRDAMALSMEFDLTDQTDQHLVDIGPETLQGDYYSAQLLPGSYVIESYAESGNKLGYEITSLGSSLLRVEPQTMSRFELELQELTQLSIFLHPELQYAYALGLYPSRLRIHPNPHTESFNRSQVPSVELQLSTELKVEALQVSQSADLQVSLFAAQRELLFSSVQMIARAFSGETLIGTYQHSHRFRSLLLGPFATPLGAFNDGELLLDMSYNGEVSGGDMSSAHEVMELALELRERMQQIESNCRLGLPTQHFHMNGGLEADSSADGHALVLLRGNATQDLNSFLLLASPMLVYYGPQEADPELVFAAFGEARVLKNQQPWTYAECSVMLSESNATWHTEMEERPSWSVNGTGRMLYRDGLDMITTY